MQCDAPRSPATALGEMPQPVRFTRARRRLWQPALCTYLPADDYLFILVLIGDSGVGKSCLLLRFAVRAACVFAKNWLRLALCRLLGLTRAFSGGAGR